MKKQILILMMGMILLLVLNVNAELCKVVSDSREAVEEYTYTKQVPVMESKTIEVNKTIIAYKDKTISFNSTKNITSSRVIKVPVREIIKVPKTINVQKKETKTKYRFISKFPFVESYQKEVLIYTTEQVTESRIKKGFYFNEDNGEFYKMKEKEKC